MTYYKVSYDDCVFADTIEEAKERVLNVIKETPYIFTRYSKVKEEILK